MKDQQGDELPHACPYLSEHLSYAFLTDEKGNNTHLIKELEDCPTCGPIWATIRSHPDFPDNINGKEK